MNRYGVKERTIALLAADLADPFTQRFCRGVTKKAEEEGGIRVLIFPGKYIGAEAVRGDLKPYDYQYNTLFAYPCAQNVDGALIISGALGSRTDRASNIAFLERFGDLPVVLAAADYEGYPAVNYDNEAGVKDAMEYMINVVGLTRICMIGSGEGSSDASLRRRAYLESLRQHHIPFEARYYVECDLSGKNEAAAEQLLDANPDAEAVFCVNDEIARMLYRVMKRRGLTPGQDIRVLGFDNDQMCTRMDPVLASVGADVAEMGYKALTMLLKRIAGARVTSVTVPTELYVRRSVDALADRLFEPALELLDEGHLDELFDTIFYRYRDELHGRNEVDIRRCFHECVSRIRQGIRNRYVDDTQAREIRRLIQVFFRNGALQYTDTYLVMRYLGLFQNRLIRRDVEGLTLSVASPFFEYMREQISIVQAKNMVLFREIYEGHLQALQALLGGSVSAADCEGESGLGSGFDAVFTAAGKAGIRNALLYLFETPLRHKKGEAFVPPGEMLLAALYKQGSGLEIAARRQRRSLTDLFRAPELYAEAGSMAVYPLFCGETIYGLLLFDNVEQMYDLGEVFASALGTALHINFNRR